MSGALALAQFLFPAAIKERLCPKVSLGINFAKPIPGGLKHFSGLQRRKMQCIKSCNAERMPKPSRKASFWAKPKQAEPEKAKSY